MDINKYAVFVDVADTLNFTKSGEKLGYTQSGISRVLKTLENEMGFHPLQAGRRPDEKC